MKVDLHFHFRKNKEDRLERLSTMVKVAESMGIRGIALLDHNYFPTDDVLEVAKTSAPLITFWRACELDVIDEARGIKNHVVVISEEGLPFDISHGVTTKDICHLSEAVSREDVLTMLAHPFRHDRFSISFDFHQFKPDLIDAVGRTANQYSLRRVTSLAATWNMGLASASDSHDKKHVGRHCIDFKEDAKVVKDLKRMVVLSQYSLITQ